MQLLNKQINFCLARPDLVQAVHDLHDSDWQNIKLLMTQTPSCIFER